MSIHHRVLPIAHPTWCAAPFCESPYPSDVRHASVPTLTNCTPLDDVVFSVSRVRDDEFLSSDHRWIQCEQGVRLDLTNTAVEDETFVALLPRHAVQRLIADLQALDAEIWGEDTTEQGDRS